MIGFEKEYGEGLYELALEEHDRQRIHAELMEVRDLIREQPDFVRLLSSRAIERGERLRVVDEAFAGRAHPYIVNFMKLLVERERFGAFEECVKWFHACYNEDFGILEAVVTSAVPLPQTEQQALKAKLCTLSGKNVALILRVDPALIGGVRVEMDGRRYDNTILGKLTRLKDELNQAGAAHSVAPKQAEA